MNAPDQIQDTWRQWLRQAIRFTGLKPTPFATEAGLAPSTITRALDGQADITVKTIEKIVRTHKVPPPGALAMQSAGEPEPPGFHEPEVQPVEPPKALGQASPNQSDWLISGRALTLAGYLPGDIVTIDQGVAPQNGDIVIAQIYDLARARAETVIRRYQSGRGQPYLTIASADPDALAIAPEFVDGERVKVMGTVVRSVRYREGA